MKPEHIDMIKNQLDEIEDLFNLNCENPKFKKWHKKTEMILEEILGKNDDKIKEFKDIDFFAMINMMPGEVFPTQMDVDAYGQDLEEAKLILETIIERYEMFEKDKQLMKLDNETIRAKVLEEAYKKYKTGSFNDFLDRKNLINKLRITKADYDRNEQYLERKGLIDFPARGALAISDIGVDCMENSSTDEESPMPKIQISGDHAQVSVSIVRGNLSSAISTIEKKGIEELPGILEQLSQIIESSSLRKEDKIEVIENLETITEQANKTKPNKNVVKAAADVILNYAGKMEPVVSLVNKLIEWFNQIST